jgi:hypothetical protein
MRWISEGISPMGVILIDSAVQITYTLQSNGWVGIVKDIRSLSLSCTGKLMFFYKMTGASNTIELKLYYAKGTGAFADREPIYLTTRRGKTDTSDWVRVEVPYDDIICVWPDTGCILGEKVDPSKVRKISFAISFASGGAPGPGSITIDSVQAIRASTRVP